MEYIKNAMKIIKERNINSEESKQYLQLCVTELMSSRLKIDRQIISDTVQDMNIRELVIYKEALEEQLFS